MNIPKTVSTLAASSRSGASRPAFCSERRTAGSSGWTTAHQGICPKQTDL